MSKFGEILLFLSKLILSFKIYYKNTRDHLDTLVTYPLFSMIWIFFGGVKKILVPNFDTVWGHSVPIVFRG